MIKFYFYIERKNPFEIILHSLDIIKIIFSSQIYPLPYTHEEINFVTTVLHLDLLITHRVNRILKSKII